MGKGIGALFEYETPKQVQISNIKVGIAHRVLQLLLLIYVVCWVMIYEKAYQDTEKAKSSVTTKVKGIGFTNYTEIPYLGIRAWDVADLVIPPLENNAFFVITNIVITHGQKSGKCLEEEWLPGAKCSDDSGCDPTKISHVGNGVYTGKCLREPNSKSGVCEIYAWCPLENDTLPLGKQKYSFPMVQNFTLLIKNDINFEKFKVHRRNIQPWSSKTFFRSCNYNKSHPENQFCPIFRFGTLFEEANVDESIFIYGGVIGIDIEWDCDLDWDEMYCNPKYSFKRLDDANAKIASGFNYRYANVYFVNGTLHRDLIKAHGIRFIINVVATAGKFDLMTFTLSMGSSLALLGLAPTFCDIIILNLMSSRKIYKKAKFETIEEERSLMASRKVSRGNTREPLPPELVVLQIKKLLKRKRQDMQAGAATDTNAATE